MARVRVWYFTHFQQYFSYIVAIGFIGGGHRSTRHDASHWQTLSEIFNRVQLSWAWIFRNHI